MAEDSEDTASEASEWEARDQAERAWERGEEEERLGAEQGGVFWCFLSFFRSYFLCFLTPFYGDEGG